MALAAAFVQRNIDAAEQAAAGFAVAGGALSVGGHFNNFSILLRSILAKILGAYMVMLFQPSIYQPRLFFSTLFTPENR